MDAAAVRTTAPIPREAGLYYYEVSVVDCGTSGYIAIGLGKQTVSLSKLPGWEPNSYGYHGDDGRFFSGQSTGEAFGPVYTTGDVIGCGISYAGLVGEDSDFGATIFYTKNGKFLGSCRPLLRGSFFPSVGLRTKNEHVRANFGAAPFVFDIDSYVRVASERAAAAIAAVSVVETVDRSGDIPGVKHAGIAGQDAGVGASTEALDGTSAPPLSASLNTLHCAILSHLMLNGHTHTAAAFMDDISEESAWQGMAGWKTQEGLASDLASAAAVRTGAFGPDRVSRFVGDMPVAYDFHAREELTRLLVAERRPEGVLSRLVTLYPGTQFKTKLIFALENEVFIQACLRLMDEGRQTLTGPVPPVVDATVVTSSSIEPDAVSSPDDTGALLAYGARLRTRFPKYSQVVLHSLALLAYPTRSAVPPFLHELLGEERLVDLARRLNAHLLQVQGVPPASLLETAAVRTQALVDLLAEKGFGAAAMVGVRGG